MANIFSTLPFRQKFLLVLTLAVGFFIWLSYKTHIISQDSINTFIFVYSGSVPLMILVFPTIMDLNDKKIFLVWFVLSILLLLISIFTNKMDYFLIQRSEEFDETSGINSFIVDHSTSSLKALFFFLVVYWFLNRLSKRKSGDFIVNTAKQSTWVHPETNRAITALDVFSNIILYVTIICSVLFQIK